MSASLKEYRDKALEDILDCLWRQWSALGVPGYGGKAVASVVDPEALLALTCTFGRYDPRLFDEALNWLMRYERFINVQRLHTLFRKELFTGKSTLAAIAATLQGKNRRSRWRLFRKFAAPNPEITQPLFLLPGGAPAPLGAACDPVFERMGWQRDPLQERKHGVFRAHGAGALLLRMRALIGVNARCEILLYLMSNTTGYPSEIAAETYYAQKTVHDALNDMVISGYLSSMRKKRERLCRINGDRLPAALLADQQTPVWLNWPIMLGALESSWRSLDTLAAMDADTALERSQVREIAQTLVDTLYSKRNIPTLPAPDPRSLEGSMRPILETIGFIGKGT